MSRLVFESGKQKEFLESVMKTLNCNSAALAKIVRISTRCMQKWLNESTLGKQSSITLLSNLSSIPLPEIIEIRNEYWGRKKSEKHMLSQTIKLQRCPGSDIGRQKGGHNSWIKRRENPDKYRSFGCIVTNQFSYPDYTNSKFAEFIGITLGDGGLTPSQLKISLNREADKDYIVYVIQLIHELFNYQATRISRKNACVVDILITGVNFTSFLVKSGLRIGNKVRHQVEVPVWIQRDISLAKSCVRGLIDTDGCIYINKYQVNNKWYQYRKVDFTNHSQPLLHFVHDVLQKIDLHPTYHLNRSVRLSNENETLKYLDLVGSSNPRLQAFNY